MDKQKKIEEMKKDIAVRMEMAKGFAGSMNNGVEGWLASYLYNLGYRKIPEGAVVLTEEELKEKIDCCDVSMIHHDDDGKRYIEYEKYEDFTDRLGERIQQLKGQLKQERKETAEKFARLVEFHSVSTRDENGREIFTISALGLKEILHEEFGIPYDEIAKEITEKM